MARRSNKKQNNKEKEQDIKAKAAEETMDEAVENQAEKDSKTSDNEQDELSMAQQEIAELKDKHLRLFSEFDNYRKRTAKERIDLFKTANADLMSDLLPVLDDFDRALQAMEKTEADAALIDGVELIRNKLMTTLEKKGLKGMDAKGKDFDTDFHEAITEFPVEDEAMKQKVVDVVEKGYMLNDIVLRYAKVVVGK